MRYYRHYSFDLWLTLIRSNPEFKAARSEYFYRHFNAKRKSISEVQSIFRQVDLMCNAVNERVGKNVDADEMYTMVISLINDHAIGEIDFDHEQLYREMESLVFNYLPQVYDADVVETLAHLKNRRDTTLSILSNTGFIQGATLRKVLDQLELNSYFDFQLYSDEHRMSKPNPFFFSLMLDQVSDCRSGEQLDRADIVHVGDNPLADIEGARRSGIAALLINSNQTSILSLIDTCTLPIH